MAGAAILSGYLSIEGLSHAAGYAVKRSDASNHVIYSQSSDLGSAIIWTSSSATGGSGPTSFLKVGPSRLRYSNDGSTEYNIFHEGFKPTAADVNALSTTGGTVSGIFSTTVNDAMAIRARRAGYWAMMGCSNTAGEYVFGGGADNLTDYQHYIRIGSAKFQFQSGGTAYNVFHEGYVPTAATVGAL